MVRAVLYIFLAIIIITLLRSIIELSAKPLPRSSSRMRTREPEMPSRAKQAN
jgi:hypothetical protein